MNIPAFVLVLALSTAFGVEAFNSTTKGEDCQLTNVNGSLASTIKCYKGLLKDLLNDYDIRVRPRLDQLLAVEVNITFSVISLVKFDISGQRIDIMGYFNITWIDELLQWNPKDYEWTNSVNLPLNSIWSPKLVFSQTYDEIRSIGNKFTDNVKISFDGLVNWLPYGIYSSVCEVTVEYYPFDVQTCEFVYFASDESIATVLLNQKETITLRYYVENSEWHLVDVSTRVIETFSMNVVTLTFTIERRPGFTVYTMIIPLTVIALINIFTFLVPIESGEKISLAITLFLAYGFFVTITRDSLPHNSIQVSYYIVYITTLLVLSGFAVIYVIVQAKLHSSHGPKPFHICQFKSNRVQSVDLESEKKEIDDSIQNPAKEKELTWTDALKKIDVVVFVTSIMIFIIFSSVLGKIVVMRE